jgi:hypothetical protein
MFELDTRRLGAMCSYDGPTPSRPHEFIETLSAKQMLSLLGRLQQEFGLHGPVDGDPVIAVAQCITWLQSELRSFEANSAALIAVLSALAVSGQSIDLLNVGIDEDTVPSTQLKALKMCRDFENGCLASQIEHVITLRVEEAVQSSDLKKLRDFLTFFNSSSDALINSEFAKKTAGRILTHKVPLLARNEIPADTVAKLQELGFAVIDGQKSRVSQLVKDIDAICGAPEVKPDRSYYSDWYDWWREQP